MSPRQRKIFYRDRSVGFTASVLLHAVLLIGGGALFAQGAQFAVDPGMGSIEVNLVAAPADAPVEMIHMPEPPKAEPAVVPDDMPLSQHALEERRLPEAPKPVPAPTSLKGDSSSSVPGQDPTTFQSAGGALTEAKPNYLRNPAPPYPYEARQKGWEGLVVLRAAVDRTGHPTVVEIENSSGHEILDKSALRTVRSWKFRPAQLGALTVDSIVRVPVRFKLNEYKKEGLHAI